VHRAGQHVCHDIDPQRCARCFGESPLGTRAAFGRLAGRQRLTAGPLTIAARAVRAVAPRFTAALSNHLPALPATIRDIERRLESARALYSEVDLFVAPSAAMAAEYVKLGMPAERIRIADYGFRPRSRPPAPRRSGGVLRLGFVGTPVWHKGVHLLIDAVAALPPGTWSLTVVGDTSVFPDYAADLRTRASGLPVRFAGAIARADIERVYDEIDVLVVPSVWLENSPLVIHEAQMAGVPVVGSNIGGIPGLVQHDVNGLLFEPGDAASLERALRRLIADPALAVRLATATPTVRSLDEDARAWEDIYAGAPVPSPIAAVS
jgi:glycosyltransferase involved in cell wall biosynthesis